ncbi:L,D-transpeptidase family protein [Pedomonas mirosovicensis]|uniref:L,D-transpeptidase family protein n=1 Tax=Pedomonas mirosovicensis TaxID=2908641 RepID=UPI00216A2869|nr:L,D-transpeptidase family protein [Pedomonas mirosovicensis]MCH8684123.1 L,D-transpeptidase family protein [Pedomonas mirosovicensis]
MADRLIVETATGVLRWGKQSTPCAIGKGGAKPEADKREGDGATPLGSYALRWVYFRPDRVPPPATALPIRGLCRQDGWCDDPQSPAYNRPVVLPCDASAEALWREDGLYDLIVVLGHNDAPARAGLGSAIFLHCCKYDDTGAMKPTLGCVAVPRETLAGILKACTPQTVIEIVG